MAERAIDTGSVDRLTAALSDALYHEAKHRFDHLMELEARSDRGLSAWRDYTSAMLGLQVWSQKLRLAMKAPAHEGHEDVH